MNEQRVSEILTRYQGDSSSIIAILQDIQEDSVIFPRRF